MKKALLVLFALVLVVCLTSCGDDNRVGTYDLTEMDMDGTKLSADDLAEYKEILGLSSVGSLVLNKDKTGTLTIMGETENFKWDDKKFSGDGGDIAYTFKDNVITLEDNGETMTFTKTK